MLQKVLVGKEVILGTPGVNQRRDILHTTGHSNIRETFEKLSADRLGETCT
jgi:hypothetical protein